MDKAAEHAEISGGVVVGHDASDSSTRALRWAAEEAALRGYPLCVLRAWTIATAPRPPSWRPGYVPSEQEYEEAVRVALRQDVERILGGHAGVEVVCLPVHGPAAQALLATSRNAALVVVGSRGRGGFASLVLGSVAEQVVRHAHCPVVVVRYSE